MAQRHIRKTKQRPASDVRARAANRARATRHSSAAAGSVLASARRAEARAHIRLEELAHLHRAHTANELAATLAHELSQPLAAISSLSEATFMGLEAGSLELDRVARNLKSIGDQAMRAGTFIKELRQFVATGEIERRALDLNALVRSACALAAPIARRHSVRVLLGLARDLPAVAAAGIQVEQVIANLLRNAIEAIAQAGMRAGEVRVSTCATSDGMARATVTDSGPGVAADEVERVFEPFFTTKTEGLGMGLRVSRTIVEAHGGRLWAESGPGGVFAFSLPFAK